MKISQVFYTIYVFLCIVLSIYTSVDAISNSPNRYSPIKRGYPPPPQPPPVKIHYGPKPPPNQIYKGHNEHLLYSNQSPNRGLVIRGHLGGPPNSHLSAPPNGFPSGPPNIHLSGPSSGHLSGPPNSHPNGPSNVHFSAPPNHLLHSAQIPPHSFQPNGPQTQHHGSLLGHAINLQHVPIRHGPQTFNIPELTTPLPKAPTQHFHYQGPSREFVGHRTPISQSTISSQKLQSSTWKSDTATPFKAPVVKESFHASPSSTTFQSTSQFDNDKGPIHTIPAPNLSLADKDQHQIKHLKQIEEQNQFKQAQEQREHLKHVHEQQEHLKHVHEQQEHLKHVREQQEHLKHQQEHLKHVREQQEHLKHVHEQQNRFKQVQEQQNQYSHIHEQQHHVKHAQQHQQHLNHIQEPHLNHIQEPHSNHFHDQQLHHHQHHHQKTRIPQPSRPLHTDHTPVVTTHLKINPLTSFKVMEDQTAHKPGEPSYFAPDPDPSYKPPKVPPTNDPFSLPSNGQLPLDLIIQQQKDREVEHLQHLSGTISKHPQHSLGTGSSEHMTAQDLFNIFNTINSQQQLEVIPPSAVDQGLNNDNHGLGDQKIQHELQNFQGLNNNHGLGDHQEIKPEPQNFNPQYETFNYDERTQQGGYGSDSYPLASSTSFEYKRAVEKHTAYSKPPPVGANQNLIHMSMAKSNKPHKVLTNSGDLVNNQVVDFNVDHEGEREIVKPTNNHQMLSPSNKGQTLTTHLTGSSGQNGGDGTVEEEEEEGEEGEEEEEVQNGVGVLKNHNQQKEDSKSVSNHEGNVQVQKSVQIYETSYFDKSHPVKQENRNQQEYEDEYVQEEEDMEDGESQSPQIIDKNNKMETLSGSVSFGERIAPKRN